MLPKNPEESAMTTHTIYINPNFNRSRATTPATHINPNFLLPRTTTAIHLNPNFLQQKVSGPQLLPDVLHLQQEQLQQSNVIPSKTFPRLANDAETQLADVIGTNCVPGPSCKLITKSRMRIIRDPKVNPVKVVPTLSDSQSPMIKLGRCKLLRRNLLHTVPPIKVETKSSTAHRSNKYKLDRRRIRSSTAPCVPPLEKSRRRSFVTRYSLRRCTNVINKRKLNLSSISSTLKPSIISKNKNLQMLNINGVLYKSTHNKLQRKDVPHGIQVPVINHSKLKGPDAQTTKRHSGRTVIVRGTRFMMDKEGFKLTRVTDANITKRATLDRSNNLRRIDIGGLTYVATSKNVFVRTGNHIARLHVNNAKQKSVQLLTRSLVKSNVPCAIFQHLGKCAAYERGKCHKVHDKRQVVICTRFLRGNCGNPKCLLSHNVSLTKMPVCKFFLQGVCVRTDCPYLHKKVGKNTEICNDFLRGYCKLADKCNKRHEFLCPDYERNGKCDKISCIYCKKKKQVHKDLLKPISQQEQPPVTEFCKESEIAPIKRYFVDDTVTEKRVNIKQRTESTEDSTANNDDGIHELQSEVNRSSRPKLGSLPSFIPFS